MKLPSFDVFLSAAEGHGAHEGGLLSTKAVEFVKAGRFVRRRFQGLRRGPAANPRRIERVTERPAFRRLHERKPSRSVKMRAACAPPPTIPRGPPSSARSF